MMSDGGNGEEGSTPRGVPQAVKDRPGHSESRGSHPMDAIKRTIEMADLQFLTVKQGVSVWAETNWDKLPGKGSKNAKG